MLPRFLVAAMLLSCLPGYPEDSDAFCTQVSISEIAEKDPSAVIGFNDDKIYLNPDRIIPTSEGLFFNLNDGNCVAIPLLYSDADGCYVRSMLQILNTCPDCGRDYFVVCRNPKCKSVDRKIEYEREAKRKKEEYKKRKK